MKEICAQFGLAAYHVQVCERKIILLVSFVSASQESEPTAEAYDNAVERFDAQTLGQLLKSLRKVISIDSSTDEILRTALTKRNYLMHRFFWEHAENVLSETGRARMISELSEHTRFFSHLAVTLDLMIYALAGALAKARGVPVDTFQREARRQFEQMLESAQARDHTEGG